MLPVLTRPALLALLNRLESVMILDYHSHSDLHCTHTIQEHIRVCCEGRVLALNSVNESEELEGVGLRGLRRKHSSLRSVQGLFFMNILLL